LEGYLVYTAESESPEEYHIWVAISNIAGALRRKVWLDMGYFKVYPNLYIVLVSPPGRCKKSTAMRTGRGILDEVPGLSSSVDSITRERLIQDLSMAHKDGMSPLTMHSSEFGSLLTSSGMDMVVFLTDIFDSPGQWTHKTKSSGTTTIRAPFLNMLAGTTTDWISRSLPLETVGIGLTSRVIFVYSDQPRVKPPRPKLDENQKALQELLTIDLNTIGQISGEYQFADDAAEMYDAWYMARVQRPNPTNDRRLDGYFERKPVHLIKVAMIVAASQTDERIITVKHLERAMWLFDRIEPRMSHVFAGVGRNPLTQSFADMLATVVNREGGVTKAELVEMFYNSVRQEELDEILGMLMEMKKIGLNGEGKYYALTAKP
jgi:hypothetical protein